MVMVSASPSTTRCPRFLVSWIWRMQSLTDLCQLNFKCAAGTGTGVVLALLDGRSAN